MSGPLAGMAKAADEVHEMMTLIAERQPALISALRERMAELADWTRDLFQPLIDLGEGRITFEEFQAIQAERDRVVQAERRAHYGEADAVYPVCEHCGAEHEWIIEEHDGDYPPIYFECEDVDGISCQDDDELDDEEDDNGNQD